MRATETAPGLASYQFPPRQNTIWKTDLAFTADYRPNKKQDVAWADRKIIIIHTSDEVGRWYDFHSASSSMPWTPCTTLVLPPSTTSKLCKRHSSLEWRLFVPLHSFLRLMLLLSVVLVPGQVITGRWRRAGLELTLWGSQSANAKWAI